MGISSLQRLPECPAPPCPVSPAGTARPAPWFGGSGAAACAVPLSPPVAVHLEQAGGCAGRWRWPVCGSSALHRVARVWGGRGLSQPGLALVHRFRNGSCSCPAAGAPLPPAVAMVKQQLANQSLAGDRAHSRRCDSALRRVGSGLGTGGLAALLVACSRPLPPPHSRHRGPWPGTGPRHTLEPRSWAVPESQSSRLVGRPPETPPPNPALRESLPPLVLAPGGLLLSLPLPSPA